MHDIQTQNRHAFIQGDVNRLRQGIALNLAHSPAAKPQQNKSKQISHILQNQLLAKQNTVYNKPK